MISFTRTASGIANYPRFHQTDVVAFVEGRVLGHEAADQGGDPDDVYYFSTLLSAASNGKSVKVKCVGNKAAALQYAQKIDAGALKNAFVVVDKDLEGVTSSPLKRGALIRTYGYSWENELWSHQTLAVVLSQLTHNSDAALTALAASIHKVERRLKMLSSLDAACQASNFALLPKKSALCGVQVEPSRPNAIGATEMARILDKYRASPAGSCPTARLIVVESMKLPAKQVIQGHFWANVCAKLLGHFYKAFAKDVAPSKKLLLGLSMAALRANPAGMVGADVFDNYAVELHRLGIA
jgi:hypothetical protein